MTTTEGLEQLLSSCHGEIKLVVVNAENSEVTCNRGIYHMLSRVRCLHVTNYLVRVMLFSHLHNIWHSISTHQFFNMMSSQDDPFLQAQSSV